MGRLPWFAFECLRSRFLRPRLAMRMLRVLRIRPLIAAVASLLWFDRAANSRDEVG